MIIPPLKSLLPPAVNTQCRWSTCPPAQTQGVRGYRPQSLNYSHSSTFFFFFHKQPIVFCGFTRTHPTLSIPQEVCKNWQIHNRGPHYHEVTPPSDAVYEQTALLRPGGESAPPASITSFTVPPTKNIQ